MDPSKETKSAPALSNKVVIACAALIIAAIVIVAFLLLSNKTQETDSSRIGYATEATVMLDQESLQAAMDEAMRNAEEGNISLRYQNDATSSDGSTFKCYLANSEMNRYDMYLAIFENADMADQLFLSGLVPPGSGFEEITLDRPLESGDHRVYVVQTHVKDNEEGQQVIVGQVSFTVDFHVA